MTVVNEKPEPLPFPTVTVDTLQIGKERGLVRFATETGKLFDVSMSAVAATKYIDLLGKKVELHVAPYEPQ